MSIVVLLSGAVMIVHSVAWIEETALQRERRTYERQETVDYRGIEGRLLLRPVTNTHAPETLLRPADAN